MDHRSCGMNFYCREHSHIKQMQEKNSRVLWILALRLSLCQYLRDNSRSAGGRCDPTAGPRLKGANANISANPGHRDRYAGFRQLEISWNKPQRTGAA